MPDDITLPADPAPDGAPAAPAEPAAVPEDDGLGIFTLTGDEDGEGGQPADGSEGGEGEDGKAAEASVPEGWAIDETASGIPADYHEDLGKLAAKHGLSGAAAAAFLQEAVGYGNARELAARKADAAALREEWGPEFDSRLRANKAFLVRVAKANGLPVEAMSGYMNPSALRTVDMFRSFGGDPGRLPGGGGGVPTRMSVEEQIDAIYNDPEAVKAMMRPGTAEYQQVHSKINKLMGIE